MGEKDRSGTPLSKRIQIVVKNLTDASLKIVKRKSSESNAYLRKAQL
jgi:hypothetical protein